MMMIIGFNNLNSNFFPRATSEGFSLCRLTAGVEMSAALVEVTAADRY